MPIHDKELYLILTDNLINASIFSKLYTENNLCIIHLKYSVHNYLKILS